MHVSMNGRGGREGLTKGVKASTSISIAPASCLHPAGLVQRRPCLCAWECAVLIMLCFGAPMCAEGQWIRGVVIKPLPGLTLSLPATGRLTPRHTALSVQAQSIQGRCYGHAASLIWMQQSLGVTIMSRMNVT